MNNGKWVVGIIAILITVLSFVAISIMKSTAAREKAAAEAAATKEPVAETK